MDDFLDRLRKALIQQEGRVPRDCTRDHIAYKDNRKIWTTGYGFNLQDSSAGKYLAKVTTKTAADLIAHKSFLTEDEALKLLDERIKVAISDTRSLVPNYDTLDPPRQLVLVCMSYQLGQPKMSEFKGMLAALNSKDFNGAAAHMLNSRWGHQTRERVQMLANALTVGQYPDMSTVARPRKKGASVRRGSARHIPSENRNRMEKEGRALALQRDLLRTWNGVTSALKNEVIEIAEYWQSAFEQHKQALQDEARRNEIAAMTQEMADLQSQANAIYVRYINTVQAINETQSRQSILGKVQAIIGLIESGISLGSSIFGGGDQPVTAQGAPEAPIADDLHYSTSHSIELNGVRMTETYEVNGSRDAIRNLNQKLLDRYRVNSMPLGGPPPPPPNIPIRP